MAFLSYYFPASRARRRAAGETRTRMSGGVWTGRSILSVTRLDHPQMCREFISLWARSFKVHRYMSKNCGYLMTPGARSEGATNAQTISLQVICTAETRKLHFFQSG